MKKIVMLSFLLFSLFIGHTSASDNLKVYLFDELVDMDNPIIVNGNTLVPLRVLFESLGASVTWDDQNKTVKAKKGITDLSIQIGNKNVQKNGTTVTLEEPAAIINEKTYVPLRFVAESFNQDVNWDKENNAIHIGKSLDARAISKTVSPAVVYIETRDVGGRPFSSGSGFIVDKSGIIVTNYHVINRAHSAIVKLSTGTILNVLNVINYNVDRDIAILKIGTTIPLPVVSLGDSDKTQNGDKIFAIGSPLGLENSITDGIISSNSRFMDGTQFLQISAPISHGNSGGPLINYKGEVVGINTLTRTDGQNINFSISINEYKKISNNQLNLSIEQVYNNEHVINYPNGNYVGDKKNNVPNGFGVMKWNAGDQYIGDFLNGARTGKGKYTWANGASYDGDWVNSLKQGYGKDADASGNVYEGPFSNGFANGKGKVSYVNGDTLYCVFLNGKANGYGTYYYANGQSISGTWVNDNYIK